MSLTDQLAQVLAAESNRNKNEHNLSKAIEAIDSLKRQGILEPTKYKLPLADTLGRHTHGGRGRANT